MKPFNESDFGALETRPARPRHACARASLQVDFLRPAGLPAAERARWTRLSARAGPGNIFAQDWFMEPALRHCGRSGSLRLAVVRQETGEWLGVLPLTFETRLGRCPLPGRHAWLATNQFIGTPLVLPGAEKTFWQALLARLDQRPGLALALCCDTLPLDDPSTLALTSLCAEQGRPIRCSRQFTRPARPAPRQWQGRSARLAQSSTNALGGLERRLARDLGPVSLVMHTRAEEKRTVGRCVPGAGNGRAGKAAPTVRWPAARPHRGCSARRSVTASASGWRGFASLRAGDRIVAMTSWFVADGHGYGFKMAYDEAWRHCAPGRLLMQRVARLLDERDPIAVRHLRPTKCALRSLVARPAGSWAISLSRSAAKPGADWLDVLLDTREYWWGARPRLKAAFLRDRQSGLTTTGSDINMIS